MARKVAGYPDGLVKRWDVCGRWGFRRPAPHTDLNVRYYMLESQTMLRRDLLKSAAAGAGFTILRSGTLRGQNAPSNKLNIALIGVWGRGTAHYNVLRNENVVALCDVNDLRTKEALEIFPKAKTYSDWRRLLDQKDVEAVIICTADHHHAFIANWAMNRGMHVYCEKPLGISIEE